MVYGGIPRSLVSLLKEIRGEYDVDLLLFWQGGDYLEEVPEGVNLLSPKGLLPLLGMPQSVAMREAPAGSLLRAGFVGWSRVFSHRTPRKMTFATVPKLTGYDIAVSYAQDNSAKNYAIGCNDFVLEKVEAPLKVAFVHCDFLRYGGNDAVTREQYRRFDRIACVSRSARKSLLNAIPELRGRAYVVENCTDFEGIRRLAQEPVEPYEPFASFALESGSDKEDNADAADDAGNADRAQQRAGVFRAINMVSVSRVTEEKGHLRAIAVLKDIMAEYPGLTWTVVGDGPYMKPVVYAARDAGILGRIFFTGAQANPYPYMAKADFFFLPSLHEAAPMVIGEAKALGLPVFSTDTCTMTKKMKEDGGGIVCPNSEEGLREGLRGLLAEPEQLDAIRERIAQMPMDNNKSKAQFARMLEGIRRPNGDSAFDGSAADDHAVGDRAAGNSAGGSGPDAGGADEPGLSVIVPVYNREKVIARCAESLFNQDFNDYEVIFVDDGSDDGTPEVLAQIAARHPQARIIRQENGGVARARNAGLAAATGRYVTWVDSDDWIEKDSLSRLWSIAEQWEADVLLFDGWEVSPEGSWPYSACEEPFSFAAGRLSRAEYLLTRPCPWNKWIRREILAPRSDCPDFHFPEGEIYEDLSAIPTLAMRTDRIYYSKTSVYHYWQSEGSIMHQSGWQENMRCIFRAVRRLQKILVRDFPEEVEYLWWRHLLVNASPRFLECGRQDMAEKAARWMKKYFPQWRKNPYVKRSSRGARISASLLAAQNYVGYRRYRDVADRAKKKRQDKADRAEKRRLDRADQAEERRLDRADRAAERRQDKGEGAKKKRPSEKRRFRQHE